MFKQISSQTITTYQRKQLDPANKGFQCKAVCSWNDLIWHKHLLKFNGRFQKAWSDEIRKHKRKDTENKWLINLWESLFTVSSFPLCCHSDLIRWNLQSAWEALPSGDTATESRILCKLQDDKRIRLFRIVSNLLVQILQHNHLSYVA